MPNTQAAAKAKRRVAGSRVKFPEQTRINMPAGMTERIYRAACVEDVTMQAWMRAALTVALDAADESGTA